MLAILGPVIFEVYPVNITDYERTTEAGLVEKPVMGRRPPLEFVGDGPESFTITIKLFPEKLGGLGSLSDLDAMRQSGIAQYFMRGDGVPLGWFCVGGCSEKSTYLGPHGVGRVIDASLTLKRDEPPSGPDFFASISWLLQ
ncbi:hypothetical protein BA190_09295 [Labrys sp. WJW]|uniref:phage tail protein n=1 Tax=Labrys sp. WJW TaxID=1737983 RepID=UPI00082AB5CD|nr:phage tail protein [Labrys sp. WJW]OCC05100.1 hypothetical protein BA190_09295 [Labrys sp. WJW]